MLLDYVATYPNDVISYQKSGLKLAAYTDAGYLNITKACSRAGFHAFLLEQVLILQFNGAVNTISGIIKFNMS